MTDASPVLGVPVSTPGLHVQNRLTPVDLAVVKRMIGHLIHEYGWVLGEDGNLYAPDARFAWGERVA